MSNNRPYTASVMGHQARSTIRCLSDRPDIDAYDKCVELTLIREEAGYQIARLRDEAETPEPPQQETRCDL